MFWDLGCGAGKPMAIASILFPNLKACRGVEFFPGLCKIARDAAKKVEGLGAPIEIIEEDMFKVPW